MIKTSMSNSMTKDIYNIICKNIFTSFPFKYCTAEPPHHAP